MLIYEISAKFFSLFMSLVLFFSSAGIGFPFMSSLAKAEIAYDFANEESWSAEGTVTVSANIDGEYKVYWGNSDYDVLSVDVSGYTATYSEFAEIDVEDGTGSSDIYRFAAIPDNAESVLAYYKNSLVAKCDLPENKTHNTETPVYRFGALSDLHFNRYALSLTDDACIAFPNALNFLDAFDIKLVGMSGDLSNGSETDSFEKFNYFVSKYDFPVYTSTGNHDVTEALDKDAWRSNINKGVYSDNKPVGVKDVVYDTFDFVYEPNQGNDDVFIFLCQYAWDYNNENSRILTDAQLVWLETELEKYKDRTVYLFFHTFMAHANGDRKTGEGNIVNDAGKTYSLVFTQGRPDEVKFRELMKKYKNVIQFNGHSHWAFDQFKFNPELNITDYDGTYATMVHISSVSSPRRVTKNSDETFEYYMRNSEGYLVSVYNDYIILQGIDFLRGKMLSFATFRIEK